MDWNSPAWLALFGSMIGAGAALLGVLITNGFTAYTQWKQREHDATQKGMDRISVMRREVYVQAVDLCVTAVGELPNLTQEGNQEQRTKMFNGIALAMSKVQLVCTPETAAKAQAYSAAFIEALKKLTLAAHDSRKLEIDITCHQDLVEAAVKDMKDAGEMMRQYNLAMRNDNDYFNKLLEIGQGAIERHKGLAAELSAKFDARARAVGAFQAKMLEALAPLNEQQRDLMDSVRTELGLPPQRAEDIARRQVLENATKQSVAMFSDAMVQGGSSALDNLAGQTGAVSLKPEDVRPLD